MAIKAIRGVHDILPAEAAKWQRLEAVARQVFEAYGYEEIRLPIFERTEVFVRGIGEVTDIVQKEMYTFKDRSRESLTLRPEATAALIRAYIEHGFHVSPKPVRLYTIGPMFRYERPQAGRYRQFHQINVEALGDDHAALDAEIIAMLIEFFRRLDVAGQLQLEINSIGDGKCRPIYRKRLTDYLRKHAKRLCTECRERTRRNPLRVLDCKNSDCAPVLDGAPSIYDSLCIACFEHFRDVESYLSALGISYRRNSRLVRGLDYYVRTTFELKSSHLGAQNAVAGGGRYDGLVAALGGPPDPGIGFAIGIERVASLLSQTDIHAWERRRPFAVLVPLDDQALKQLLPVAQAVRGRGIPLELGYGDRKLRAELERANRLKVPYAVIVGEAELGRGEAILKEMTSGSQRAIPLDRLVEELAALGGRP